MAYPAATAEQVAAYEEHGFLVVEDAIDPGDLADLETVLRRHPRQQGDARLRLGVVEGQESRRAGVPNPPGEPQLLVAGALHRCAVPSVGDRVRVGADAPATWSSGTTSSSPSRRAFGAATLWHQDEGYWGRNLDDLGCTAWMPFHDVDVRERLHALHRRRPPRRRARAPPARRRAERPAVLRARRVTHRRLSGACRDRHVPPLEDAPHDERQHER